MSTPWYTTQWKSNRGGTRSIIGAIAYIVAGFGFATLALLSGGAVRWLVFGAGGIWMLWLGFTLALTVRHRRVQDR